ncbi:hypothetical protein DNTS_021714 [Danionella cerebrum]|uniref:Uncharacterized protein n=1 Tax=Danionella cerebrum TaxID=2873325 RepID=A0A553P5I5_9TELE|nr:hypothetical protein DNTS_021714 [Danionella translucida]
MKELELLLFSVPPTLVSASPSSSARIRRSREAQVKEEEVEEEEDDGGIGAVEGTRPGSGPDQAENPRPPWAFKARTQPAQKERE